MLPVQDEAVRWNARQVFGEETGHPGLGTPAVEFEGGVQLLTADDHQIGQRIVEAIPVLMVNHFAWKKGTSQGLLDHETVLRDSLASPRVNHRLVGLVALFAPYLLSRFHSSVVLVLGVTEIHFCFWALAENLPRLHPLGTGLSCTALSRKTGQTINDLSSYFCCLFLFKA